MMPLRVAAGHTLIRGIFCAHAGEGQGGAGRGRRSLAVRFCVRAGRVRESPVPAGACYTAAPPSDPVPTSRRGRVPSHGSSSATTGRLVQCPAFPLSSALPNRPSRPLLCLAGSGQCPVRQKVGLDRVCNGDRTRATRRSRAAELPREGPSWGVPVPTSGAHCRCCLLTRREQAA